MQKHARTAIGTLETDVKAVIFKFPHETARDLTVENYTDKRLELCTAIELSGGEKRKEKRS